MLNVKEYQTVTSISGPLMLVEMVDETTAVALVKEMPAPNIIQACLLHRQP